MPRRRIVEGDYTSSLIYLGTAEVAELLGWDRRRVAAERSKGRLPAPAFVLAAGPVWTRAAIEDWMGSAPNPEKVEDQLQREIALRRQLLRELEQRLARVHAARRKQDRQKQAAS